VKHFSRARQDMQTSTRKSNALVQAELEHKYNKSDILPPKMNNIRAVTQTLVHNKNYDRNLREKSRKWEHEASKI